jgi:BirA family transcriptional regulator, biotin operon repressor / biotin---[acetyl-CoA-carboxylase] ligase
MRVGRVHEILQTHTTGRAIRWVDETGSTNQDAADWANDGAPDGAVLGSDHQTSGRGRLGRTWEDAPGQNLLFSIVLYPAGTDAVLNLIPLVAGVAIHEVVQQLVPDENVALKWPNDILIGGRKVCGILAESNLSASGRDLRVVCGVGLNVNQLEFNADIRTSATSLAAKAGRHFELEVVLAKCLNAFEEHYDRWLARQTGPILDIYRRHMLWLGENISLREPHSPAAITGIVRDLAEDGGLVIETPTGCRTFYAGELTSQVDG